MTLPDGWILRVSRSKGKVFYYNTRTQQTQWTRPTQATNERSPIAIQSEVDERSAVDQRPTDAKKKRKREHDAGSSDDAMVLADRTAAVSPHEGAQTDDHGRHAAIVRCMRVGASSGGKVFVPWDHQVEAVDKLLTALSEPTPSQAVQSRANRFLLQHSTGSGKTVTIAALTHQLLYFHDSSGRRFHTVVLLIDRIKLDEQVGDSVERFLRRNGVDTIYRATSIDHLANLLRSPETGSETAPRQRVIITTIQKIGLLAKNTVLLTRLLRGNATASSDNDGNVFSRIAIITDEAHRSHTAATRQTIEAVMNAGDETDQDNSVTFVGFTATPNVEALRLFGSSEATGNDEVLEPFHCYPMSRAVSDARVVDVLQNYTCVRCELEISIPNDVQQELVKTNAMRAVMDSASDDVDVLKAKSAYMMEDFARARSSWNRAKCMIVTRSRRDVVRYYELITAFVQNKRSPWRVFAVFSGTVTTEPSASSGGTCSARSVTEQSLNPKHLSLASSDIVIVCDKLDTGYSDPFLACMYIDRYLRSSVQTVQLLSRLNRQHAHKRSVQIVDFANHAAQIRRHFATFWHNAKTRSDCDGEMMPMADWRTALNVVGQMVVPGEVNVNESKQMTETVEILVRSLDRDAFQQLLDAARLGAAAWASLTDEDLEHTSEAMSPLRYQRFTSLKKALEEAISRAEDSAARAEEIASKMKTRVRTYEVVFSGKINPQELHSLSDLI